jgi:hypothetical protein
LGRIRLIDDREMPAHYVEVCAPTADLTARFASILGRHLPILSRDDLKAEARDAGGTDAGSLMRLGVGAQGPYDPEIHALIESGLRSPDLAVRTGATLAVFLLKWPEFAPAIASLLETERDDALRARLEVTAQRLKTVGAG